MQATLAAQTAGATAWLRFTCDERIGGHTAAHDLALAHSWTCVFGPSGSGKTTLLRLLAGLTPQHTGTCQLRGRDVRALPPHRRRVAFVEQSPALFPHLNVERNVAFSNHGASRAVETMLEDFHLVSLRRASVHTLSGGERQRVAIARALCSQPDALLLDEVFTGMDAALRSDLVGVLQRYQQRTAMPILSVTHDLGEAFATAGEVLRMHNGKVTAQGAPAEILAGERAALLRQLSPHESH